MRQSHLSSTAEILEQPLHDMLLVSASPDRLDGRIDIVIGPTQGDLALERVVRDPAWARVLGPAETDATDIDHGLQAGLHGMDAGFRPSLRSLPTLSPDSRHMSVADETERVRLRTEMALQRLGRIQIIKGVIRIQRPMSELDTVNLRRLGPRH